MQITRIVEMKGRWVGVSSLVLGESYLVYKHGIDVEVKFIKTSRKGYNLLMLNTHTCVFPSAQLPTDYPSFQNKGKICLIHNQHTIIKTLNK